MKEYYLPLCTLNITTHPHDTTVLVTGNTNQTSRPKSGGRFSGPPFVIKVTSI